MVTLNTASPHLRAMLERIKVEKIGDFPPPTSLLRSQYLVEQVIPELIREANERANTERDWAPSKVKFLLEEVAKISRLSLEQNGFPELRTTDHNVVALYKGVPVATSCRRVLGSDLAHSCNGQWGWEFDPVDVVANFFKLVPKRPENFDYSSWTKSFLSTIKLRRYGASDVDAASEFEIVPRIPKQVENIAFFDLTFDIGINEPAMDRVLGYQDPREAYERARLEGKLRYLSVQQRIALCYCLTLEVTSASPEQLMEHAIAAIEDDIESAIETRYEVPDRQAKAVMRRDIRRWIGANRNYRIVTLRDHWAGRPKFGESPDS